MHIEHPKTHEGIDFYAVPKVINSGALRIKRRRQVQPSVIQAWVLLWNLLAFLLMTEITRYIVAK
jgi:hypothetical protein